MDNCKTFWSTEFFLQGPLTRSNFEIAVSDPQVKISIHSWSKQMIMTIYVIILVVSVFYMTAQFFNCVILCLYFCNLIETFCIYITDHFQT